MAGEGLEKVFAVFRASGGSFLIPKIIDRAEFVFACVVCIFLKQRREKQRNRASTRYCNALWSRSWLRSSYLSMVSGMDILLPNPQVVRRCMANGTKEL